MKAAIEILHGRTQGPPLPVALMASLRESNEKYGRPQRLTDAFIKIPVRSHSGSSLQSETVEKAHLLVPTARCRDDKSYFQLTVGK